MLSLALAALSGLVWGVGDFAGGKATQTAPALTVTLTSKINCLPFLAIYLVVFYVPVVPASLPGARLADSAASWVWWSSTGRCRRG